MPKDGVKNRENDRQRGKTSSEGKPKQSVKYEDVESSEDGKEREERERQRRAGGAELGSGPGCGEVGCRGCGEASVERGSLLESESSEGGCSRCSGIRLLKKGRLFFMLRQRKREQGSQGECGQ